MTPTEQDKQLREKLDRLIIENQSEDGSIDISDQRAMRDEIMQLITADRKRVELEARVDEIEHIAGFTNGMTNQMFKNLQRRIAELKAQQEEV